MSWLHGNLCDTLTKAVHIAAESVHVQILRPPTKPMSQTLW